VLLLAETAGRRETLAAMFAEHGLKPEASADLAGFLAGDAKLALGIGPLHAGLRWTSSLSSPKPNSTPARRAAPARSAAQSHLRQLAEGPHRTQGRRPGGA
jgi:hypothetical protein